MAWMKTYLRSSIGMKQVMGVTGLLLVGFVLAHMLGNLQIFLGRRTFNEYPEKLRSLGALLWIARAGLLGIFLVHVFAGVRLMILNRAARPVGYRAYRPRRSSFYGRYMGWLGAVVLAFVIYHLLHFTFAVLLPEYSTFKDGKLHDLYEYVVLSFQNPGVAISYLIANTVLCLHLLHGLPSLFQSAGLRHPKYNRLIDRVSLTVVAALFVGNTSIPLSVLLGAVE